MSSRRPKRGVKAEKQASELQEMVEGTTRAGRIKYTAQPRYTTYRDHSSRASSETPSQSNPLPQSRSSSPVKQMISESLEVQDLTQTLAHTQIEQQSLQSPSSIPKSQAERKTKVFHLSTTEKDSTSHVHYRAKMISYGKWSRFKLNTLQHCL
jgi:hypothetical protein